METVYLKCKETQGHFMDFEKGKTYKVYKNHTNSFEVIGDSGTIHKFSKVYDSDYPNFRKLFEIVK